MRAMPWLVCIGLMLGQFGGCRSAEHDETRAASPLHDDYREANAAIVRSLHVGAVERAILRQHTIYPYHFVLNAAELNDLGAESVRVLGNHYAQHPGRINVARGDADEALHQLRVQQVVERLVAFGVPRNDIEVEDGAPGGEALSSDEAIIVRSQMIESRGESRGDGGSTIGGGN